ncbi:MAG: sensor histidine kinase [Bacteroidota bacterium]
MKISLHFYLLLVSLYFPSFTQGMGGEDSLSRALRMDISIEGKVAIYIQLHNAMETTDLALATGYIDSAWSMRDAFLNDSLSFRLYQGYASNKLKNGAYQEALEYAKVAKELAHAASEKQLALLLNNEGLAYHYQGRYPQSIGTHLLAMELFEGIGDSKGCARSYNNLGINYYWLEDYDKAKVYYTKSLEICEKLGIKEGIAHNLGNLGLIHRKKGNISQALRMYERSVEIHQELGQDFQLYQNYNNMANLWLSLDDWEQATQYLALAYELAEKSENTQDNAQCKALEGSILKTKGDFQGAEKAYLEAIQLYGEKGKVTLYKQTYLLLSELYEAAGTYEKALETRKLYEKWNDSMINASYMERIADLEMKYETEKKEVEILHLATEKQENEQKFQKERSWNRILLLSLFALIASGISINSYMRLRQHRTQQQNELETILFTQESERKRISQDLHDSLGSLLAIVRHRIAKEPEIAAMIDQSCEELRRISHNLMPAVLIKEGLIPAIEGLLNQTKYSHPIQTEFFVHIDDIKFSQKTELTLYRIIQELLQNVIKHAFADKVGVHFMQAPQKLTLMVEDDGVGFNTNHSHGMGLENIGMRVRQLKGKIVIDSSPNHGTTTIIQIPISV